jgi:hypothetical protein
MPQAGFVRGKIAQHPIKSTQNPCGRAETCVSATHPQNNKQASQTEIERRPEDGAIVLNWPTAAKQIY